MPGAGDSRVHIRLIARRRTPLFEIVGSAAVGEMVQSGVSILYAIDAQAYAL